MITSIATMRHLLPTGQTTIIHSDSKPIGCSSSHSENINWLLYKSADFLTLLFEVTATESEFKFLFELVRLERFLCRDSGLMRFELRNEIC